MLLVFCSFQGRKFKSWGTYCRRTLTYWGGKVVNVIKTEDKKALGNGKARHNMSFVSLVIKWSRNIIVGQIVFSTVNLINISLHLCYCFIPVNF